MVTMWKKHVEYYNSHGCRFINVFVYIVTILGNINCRQTSLFSTPFENINDGQHVSPGFIHPGHVQSTETTFLVFNFDSPGQSSKSSIPTSRADYIDRNHLTNTSKSSRDRVPIRNEARLASRYVSNGGGTHSLHKYDVTDLLQQRQKKNAGITKRIKKKRTDSTSVDAISEDTVRSYREKTSYNRKIKREIIEDDEWIPSFGPNTVRVSNKNDFSFKNIAATVFSSDKSFGFNSTEKKNKHDLNNIISSNSDKINLKKYYLNVKNVNKTNQTSSMHNSLDYVSQTVDDLIDRNIKDDQLLKVFNCIQNLNLVACLKMSLLERLNVAVRLSKENPRNVTTTVWFEDFMSMPKNLTQKFETYRNRSDDKIDTEISNAVAELFHGTNMKFRFMPGITLQKLNDSSNSLHIVFRVSDAVAGHIEEARKKKMSYLPLLLVPPLLMASVIPFIIPGLKMMAMLASALNQMAFMSALFSIVRGFIFDSPKSEKVIYINEGYKNEHTHNVHHGAHPANIKFYEHYSD